MASQSFIVSHLHHAQHLGFLLAQFNNLLLLLLIWLRANKNFGSYRYIMAIFAAYSLAYAWVELAVLPIMHGEGPVYAVIMDSSLKHYMGVGRFFVTLYCGSFALCISLLAAQFGYRYLVVCKPHFSLNGYKFLYVLLPCPVYFAIWFSLVFFGLEFSTEKIEPFRSIIQNFYSEDLDSIPFTALAYWYTDANGKTHWIWGSLIAIVGMDAIIGSCVSVILYCGWAIYHDLQQKGKLISEKKGDLNRQLFITLTFQTLLPFILMYMTVGFTITTPLLSLDLAEYANVCAITIAIYPSLEPCIALMCIKDFRKALMFWKRSVITAKSSITLASSHA